MRPTEPTGFICQVVLGLFLCALVSGCGSDSNSSAPPVAAPRSEHAIRTFCGDCHAFPDPVTYPAEIWPEKVQEGFKFYYSSLRKDLEVPAVDAVEEFYAERAPQELEVTATSTTSPEHGDTVFQTPETWSPEKPFRAIAQLQAVSKTPGRADLLISDMRTGSVWLMPSTRGPQTQPSLLASCFNACHTEPTDLDRDGTTDYVVADLGSFLPEDHTSGLVWYVHQDDSGKWVNDVLIDGIGRVADVRPMDADGDGDTDLVVAEFGWHATGKIFLLRNTPTKDGSPNMEMEVIDDRHGTIHVPVTDLNGDGHPDFVALVSQEHETVEAFQNRGDGTFRRHTIFRSDNPGFGSSGIQLVDMDDDDDMDVVFVNGDSLDTPIAKPYHGVLWLENEGTFPFTVHEVSKLPGGYCIRAGDIDGDGDMDLAVVTLVPGAALKAHPAETFDSVVWYEQTADGVFHGHSLERNTCLHAACELMDWDADGDLDLIVGDMVPDPAADRPLTVFRSRLHDNNGAGD